MIPNHSAYNRGNPMYRLALIFFALAAPTALFGFAAQQQDSLPSAPSAVRYPQKTQPPAPSAQQSSAQQGSASQSSGQTVNGVGAGAGTQPGSRQSSARSAGDASPAQQPGSLLPPSDSDAEAIARKNAADKAAEAASAKSSGKENTGAASDRSAASGPPDTSDTTLYKQVREVPVIFTVTDKHGHFIRNLKKEDLQVFDDKQPMRDIRSFSAQTDLPLRVGLLIDVSSSIRDRFKFEQEAAIEFFNSIITRRSDEAFVLGFDSNAEITQEFTNNTEKLANGVRMLKPAGGTALFDALYYACRERLMKVKSNTPVRRAVIIVSDGDDNQSRVTREEAIEMAQRAEVIVYTISTNLAPNKDRGDRVLERIADATGGRAFFPFKIQDVSDAFVNIQDELRSQYSLSYRPPNFIANGQFHAIDVVPVNKKLRVRARKGYFAPKASPAS